VEVSSNEPLMSYGMSLLWGLVASTHAMCPHNSDGTAAADGLSIAIEGYGPSKPRHIVLAAGFLLHSIYLTC
jgi:hypothetical protein